MSFRIDIRAKCIECKEIHHINESLDYICDECLEIKRFTKQDIVNAIEEVVSIVTEHNEPKIFISHEEAESSDKHGFFIVDKWESEREKLQYRKGIKYGLAAALIALADNLHCTEEIAKIIRKNIKEIKE